MGLFNLLFSSNERDIAKMRKIVDIINSHEPQFEENDR